LSRQAGNELLALDWFAQEVAEAGVEAVAVIAFRGPSRQRHNRLREAGRTKPSDGRHPVDDRHLQVHQDQIERAAPTVLRGSKLDRLLPVLGNGHSRPGPAEHQRQQRLMVFVVFDQQHVTIERTVRPRFLRGGRLGTVPFSGGPGGAVGCQYTAHFNAYGKRGFWPRGQTWSK